MHYDVIEELFLNSPWCLLMSLSHIQHSIYTNQNRAIFFRKPLIMIGQLKEKQSTHLYSFNL